MIKELKSDSDIARALPIMSQLRPTFKDPNVFTEIIKRLNQNYGYRLIAIVNPSGQIMAVAGFRISECLSYGKNLYIDDLVTDNEARSKGYGKQLLRWLEKEAKKENCSELHLDSGVQRHQAHRFYLREHMDIVFYHFRKQISE